MKLKKRLLSLAMLCVAWVGTFAYEVGQDITSLATDWTGKTGTYQSKYAERYSNTAYTEGKILYMSITGLESVGYYEVQFYAVTSMAWNQFATGTSIAEWYVNDVSDYMNVIGQTGCTPESETNLRTATVYVSDGNLEFGIKNIAEGGNWYVAHVKSIVYKGNPSLSNPINITSTYIKNAGYETGDTKGWTTITSSDTGARSTTSDKYKCSNSEGAYLFNTWWKGTPCVQTISSSMPAGKYELSAIVGSDGATIYLITGDNPAEYAYTETTDKAVGIKLTKEFFLSSDATNYKIGVVGGEDGTAGEHKAYVEDGYWWYKSDNFQLKYYGNGIEHYALSANAEEEFTAEAGQWYEIPVATAGDYKFTIGSGSIIYTQDGSQGKDAATGTSIENGAVCNLLAGSVFVKADAATTIMMEANTYSYELGALTQSTKDGAYVQNNGVITFTYPNAVTNDKSATATLVESATATVNGEIKTLTAVTNGFQLDLGTLTSSQVFNISIPEGVYGYADKAMNDAITMTINTPAVFDGKYYLFNSYDKKYFSRGGSYGTQACVDEYGIAVVLATDENNATSVKMFDSYMNIGFDGWVYTDSKGDNVRYFNISQVEGGYKLLNTNNSKYLATNGGYVVADAEEGVNLVGTSNIWIMEDVNNHLAVLKANDDKQAKAVAEAAGLTAETKVALETILVGEEYEARPITVTGTSGIQENFEGGSSSDKDSKPLDIFKETVTGLKPGIYKLSVNAFQRATWLEDVCNAGGARGKVYVYANDNKTQLKSIAEEPATEAYTGGKEVNGKYYPDNLNSAGVAFDKGMYVNDVYVYVTGNELTFGIQNPTRMGNDGDRGAWTAYRNFTLTYYAFANLDTYYDDLSAALLKYKPWTETGEYVTKHNEFSAACQNKTYETKDEINDAISYLQTNYPTYAWDNANMEHPYLVEGVISGAECATNDAWAGSGRRMTSGQHWSGDASRQYFRDVVDGAARSQTVIIPKVGTYLLKASVRVIDDNSYAIISVGDESVERREKTGSTGGTIAIDGTEYESVEAGKAAGATFANSNNGFGWIYNKLIFCTSSENEEKKISINLSHAEATPTRIAECGGMFLYYIGQNYDKIEGDTHYYYGDYTTAPSFEVTDEVPIVDATKASVTDATVTLTNPNGLIYLASGSTASGNNVVVDGTCANLVLTDGHPFKATKQFTAANASYNMTAVAGGKFGTLMLPFAVTTLPGKAYSLDQGVTYGGDIYATEVNAIAANSPVLVTATGAYTTTEASVAATADTYTNGELTGTYKAMPAEENTFVLQKHGDYVAFFMVKDTKPTVNPFRAYIKAQSGAASKEFVNVIFDGNTTGISNMDTDGNAANDIIYDLSGRRVNKAHKGVYIINGKKIIK
ncbi:MAG: hypothetical protein ACI3YO_10080 [Prevotella sp.]